MNMSLALKSWFSDVIDCDYVMQKYALNQDPKLLERLYNACADDLYHFLCSHTDEHNAKDIAQRTWIKVIDKRELYQSKGNFKAWLFSIGRRLLIDDYRAQRKFVDFDVEERAFTPEVIADTDFQKAFNLALMALPWRQRESFILQQEGFSLSEIADICVEPIETIKSRLRYARNNLKKQLENHHAAH